MRLNADQIETIRRLSRETAGSDARVRLFGSRLDDAARGEDIDLLLELDRPAENAALLGAQLAARVRRALAGRKVDVVVSASNLLRLPEGA